MLWEDEPQASFSGTAFSRGRLAYELNGVVMLVVSLRGVNFGFWSHLGCSEERVIICNPYVAVKVSSV